MDKAERHDLKTDPLVEAAEQAANYAGSHRQQFIRYGAIALGILAIAAGIWWFLESRKAERAAAVRDLFAAREANVGASTNFGATRRFTTQQEKEAAVLKAAEAMAAKYPGSEEAAVASYYKAVTLSDSGKLAEARKVMEQVAAMGGDYGSLAKLSIAQALQGEGKTADAEKILRDLVANPTRLVSKEQAILALGRAIADTKPDEALKLLEPLRTERSGIARNAIAVLGDITAKKQQKAKP
jgi:predicted negative regulator of RcsB-dependent stress response